MSSIKQGLLRLFPAVIFSLLSFWAVFMPAHARAADVIPTFGGVLNGTETRITTDLADQMDPAISGDIIVYTDYRGADANIWFYNLGTGMEQAVTTAAGDQVLNDVSSGVITYDDYGLGDVFVYDTSSGINTNITQNNGNGACAQEPAIGANLVAWASAGDIYAENLATGEKRRLSNSPGSADRAVAVGGGIIVYQGCSPTCAIYAYDWAAGTTTQITHSTDDHRDPDTEGSVVVYSAKPASGADGDICAYDLAAGTEKRLIMDGDQMNPNISGDYVAFEDLSSGRFRMRVWHLPTDTVFDLNLPETASQFLNDIDGNRIVYTDDRGGQLDIYLYEFVEVSLEPDIAVTPLVYAFGDVAVGTTALTIITITNTGNANLAVTDISPGDYAFWYKVTAGLNSIPPGGAGAIYVHFSPQSPGPYSTTLRIYSNDPDEGVVEVALSGNGISPEITPSEQIENILTFFDASVSNGTLVGSGPGHSAKGRLGALRNMIEMAKALIDAGDIAGAIQQLQSAYARVDGQPRPPDFAAGPAAAELADMIQQLIDSLGA